MESKFFRLPSFEIISADLQNTQLCDYNNIVILGRNWPLKVQSEAKSSVRFRRQNRNKKTVVEKKKKKNSIN